MRDEESMRAATLRALLYVSRSTLASPEITAEIGDIVDCAIVRNRRLAITGALAFSGAHFTQYLEGTPDALGVIMGSIRGDRRHSDVVVLCVSACKSDPHLGDIGVQK
ncbi:BLUF domain-containing protein [Phenylobacterium sp. VNQ135]|uniref:BLUF domain-containing protein n=1 Tax=Phenylobacterium sp. VNQ135 TaxID=3400922 RepID=UPI003C08C7D4